MSKMISATIYLYKEGKERKNTKRSISLINIP